MIAKPWLPAEAFPDSDGNPMSENTRQYEAIVALKGNVEAFAPADAFVAGDHLIYIDPTDAADRQAPDVYVAFGRPRGHRGSYKLWDEGGVFPQVVFEVLGPSNTPAEMADKRAWYFAHGAEEYYEFDPEAGTWDGWVRGPAGADPVPRMDGFVSPRLGMRFGFRPLELEVFRPDGSRFLSFAELNDAYERAARRADAEERRADAQTRRADELARQVTTLEDIARAGLDTAEAAQRRANALDEITEMERQRAERLAADNERLRERLRAAGLDPDAR